MIYINDKEHTFNSNQSLSDLFKNLNIDVAKGVAIALNEKVIPRSQWNNQKINDRDKLLLIKATQGG